ncbi:MAG: 50S ribosomal protein L23 [Candidatus Vogelbacteria bacterium]|nr:50S ribosomal protein L23 [Candidatus Vogelbacteria bacterium]
MAENKNNLGWRPHLTEKTQARQNAPRPVFTFTAPAAANKTEIKKAIGKNYQVKPIKVRVINVPSKRLIYRGRPAKKPGYKKVLVYLSPGEKIDWK